MAHDFSGQTRAGHLLACEDSADDRYRPRRRLPSALWKITAFACLIHLSLTGVGAQVRGTGRQGNDDVVLLGGAINPRARRENDRGPLERDRKLSHITLGIRRTPEQQAALDRLLEEQQNPSSPNYHNWLAPEEFGQRFGVSQDGLDKVLAWLRSEGFTVESTARGRNRIIFSGTVPQVEKAFRTGIHRYEAGARMHFAPAAPPAIPAELGSVVATIRGLDDFYWEPFLRLHPLYTATDGRHAVAPADFTAIYGFSSAPLYDGTGQSIVVVGQSAVDLADIQKFRSTFLLPANTPQTILIGDDPGLDQSGPFQEGEADLEWAGAVAPQATLVYLYARDVMDAVAAAVDRNLAPVITMSYGACEANVPTGAAAAIRDLAQQANAQGITWIASSGDSGAAGCDAGVSVATQGLSVIFPASLPEVTGVGGTEFNEGSISYWQNTNWANGESAFNYIPEVAWNDGVQSAGIAASGGGASVLYGKPAWQTGQGVPARDARFVPDISFSASPYHDPYLAIIGGSVYGAGGTSIAAPAFAGVMALLNQRVAPSTAGAGMGNVNPLLYAGPQSSAPPWLHDITTGDNMLPCMEGTPDCASGSLGYSAGPGYDPVTGLGSLNVGWFVIGVQIPTTTTMTAPANVVVEGTIVLTVKVTGTGGALPSTNPASNQGVIQVWQGQAIVGGANVTAGVATIPMQGLSPGTWTFTAHYTGDSLFGPSVSAPVTLLVTPDQPAPVLLSPANQSTGVALGVALKWNGARYAISYDVYFGTTAAPPLWGNTPGFQCTPSGLGANTTYYWRVVANTPSGPLSTATWSFTTSGQPGYTISTLAGAARLSHPADIALDSLGNVYIADSGNHQVWMVTPGGFVQLMAGSGAATDSGDLGNALSAGISGPNGIAVDAVGDIFISSGNRIRMITHGVIWTIAGGDVPGYAGDGGPAASAQLSDPSGLATDASGNLYIADTYNNCVRKIVNRGLSIDPEATITVVGICGLREMWPTGVAVSSAGDLYVAASLDDYNQDGQIWRVVNGAWTQVAGVGTPLVPEINVPLRPARVAVDGAGNVFFTSAGDRSSATLVYEISKGVLTAVAGDVNSLGLNAPNPGDGAPATSVWLGAPTGIVTGSAGMVYVADSYFARVRVLTPAGSALVPTIATGGIVNAASLNSLAVAPGSLATVYGSFGLVVPVQATATPLPNVLGGFSIQTGSVNAPLLYSSAGQANIQIPWELANQSSVPVSATLNGKGGPVQTLKLAQLAPAIFATNGQGTLQGVIVDSAYRKLDSSNPATSGSAIQIYCTGLGAVTNPPASGSPASSTTLARTTTDPTVTIGGVNAPVLFSGLVPGTVGEYQVNVQVPAGVAPGSAVSVVITIGGISSNTVTIAVK